MKVWQMFVLGVVLCWGMYVVTIHIGQKAIDDALAGKIVA